MSDSGPQILPQQDQFSGSGPTAVSRHPYLTESITSKRVSFYKSGDPQFRALRMVVNSRTFKTFDALLDSLSKKVPLPFGVRNITTPRGVHAIHTLEELEDGKSYICSDQKKVKPFDLEMASRKLPPWYHARPVSARRRAMQLARQNVGLPTRWDAAVAVRTPKRLTVFRNGDPGHRHTVILQRKTTPTFESLLDYVSELLQFHVVKLHTPDGRRVDGLPALILCSGVVVAAGREHFKPGNYDIQKPAPTTRLSAIYTQMKHSRARLKNRKKKLASRSSKSRNFSPSSERYFVNQINNSIAGSLYEFPKNPGGSMETTTNNMLGSLETETFTEDAGEDSTTAALPDDDIEKSFRINQDGSMTVEMKVRLTIKEEELVHWTTTLSRTNVANHLKADCDPETNPSADTPESNIILFKDTDKEPEINEYKPKKGSDLLLREKRDPSAEETEDTHSTDVSQPCLKREQNSSVSSIDVRQASVESIRTMSDIEVQEDMVRTYACVEENTNGEVTKEYCMVTQHCSRPIPKPRKFSSVEVNNNDMQSKSSSMAEVLQIKDNSEEVSETVLYISEQHSYNENFFANTQFRARSQSMHSSLYGQQSSSDTTVGSSSNGSEVELQRPYTASESITGRKACNPSLPLDCAAPSLLLTSNVISFSNMSINYPSKISAKDKTFSELGLNKPNDGLKDPITDQDTKAKGMNPKVKKKKIHLSKSSDKKRKDRSMDVLKASKKVKTDIFGHASSEKWLGLSRIKKQMSQQRSKRKEMKESTKRKEVSSNPPLSQSSCTINIENSTCSGKELNLAPEKPENLFNMNTKETPVSLNKNILDVLPPFESMHIRNTLIRQRSMHEDRRQKREVQELNESVSMPDLHSSGVSQYVEHWLEKIQPGPAPYLDDEDHAEVSLAPKLVLQKGCEEQSSQKESEIKYKGIEPDSVGHLTCKENTTKKSESHRSAVEMQDAAEVKIYRTSAMYQASVPKALVPGITEQPDMKAVLKDLCQSIRAIRQNSQNKRPSCLEKSNSVPDLSSHVSSTFGSSSKMLLAFLSTLTTEEDICNLGKDNSGIKNASCTEALKMMEALKKIASIEDAKELKASVTELQRSTSSQLIQSWRAFQAFGMEAHNQFFLNNSSDLELLLEPWQQESNNAEQQLLGTQLLLQQFGISERLCSQVNGISSDVTDKTSQKSEEIDSITESFANDDVKDNPDPNINGDSITKSDLKADFLNNFDQDTSSDHGIVVNVEMLSEEDSFASPQESSHRKAHETCLSFAKQQVSCAEKRTYFVKEQSSCIEDYSTFVEKQESYAGEAVYTEDEDNHSQEEIACTYEQYGYAEEVNSPHQPGSVEEVRGKAEKACYLQDNVSQEEEQTITEKQEFFESAKAISSKDEHSFKEMNTINSQLSPFCAEQRANPRKDQYSCSEQKAICLEQQRHLVDEIKDSVNRVENHTEQQSSLEESEVINEEELGSSEEGKARATEEQDSCLKEDVNKENEAIGVEDHYSCYECRGSNAEEQTYHEEEQVSWIEDGKSNIKLKGSYKEQQYGLDLEQGCPAKVKASYLEHQIGNSDNVEWYAEDVASCMIKQTSFHEQKEGYNETQFSFSEQTYEGLSWCNNTWMICEKEEASRNREESNETPKLHGTTGEWVSCDEKLPSLEEEMDSSEYEEPSHVGKQHSFDEQQDSNAESTFENKYSQVEDGNSLGKEPMDEETPVSYVESCVSNVKDGVSQIEQQCMNMQENTNSVTERDGACQVRVPRISVANASHRSSKQSKMQELIKGATKVFVKHKNANELPSHVKDLVGGVDHKKHNSNRIYNSAETVQKLVDSESPLSSSLAFSYNSRAGLKKDHEGARVKMIREMFLAKSNFDQCSHRQLPNPKTSDLSDYRPETSDSGGCKLQASPEISTESGEDDSGRQSIAKGYVRRTIEKLYGKCDASVKESTGNKAPCAMKGRHTDSRGNNSVGSLISSFQEARTKDPTDLSYFNATSKCDISNEDSHCTVLNAPAAPSAEVQSHKGCRLFRDSQLNPKMPGTARATNAKTADSRKEDVSDDIPYSHFGTHHSPLAVISSTDLEDLTRPLVPKCTYLNLPNGSDSDPFQDDLSNKMSTARAIEDAKQRDPKPPLSTEEIKSRGERNGILPLTPVDFRMSDNKVHPAEGPSAARAITTQPSRAQGMLTKPVHEQDSLDMLHLICGEHCPIL